MKLRKFDVIDFLDSDEALVEYLNAALAETTRSISSRRSETSRAPRGCLQCPK